jgi:hypothetical protein
VCDYAGIFQEAGSHPFPTVWHQFSCQFFPFMVVMSGVRDVVSDSVTTKKYGRGQTVLPDNRNDRQLLKYNHMPVQEAAISQVFREYLYHNVLQHFTVGGTRFRRPKWF